jgi:nicotinate-nucleotide adenylyltransferase
MSGVCLFGGAFDPPHASHRRIIETALRELGPDRLLVIPCGDHPLKAPAVAPGAHRLRMCELAFGDLAPRVVVDRREVGRSGPSYTIDTVRQLRAERGFDEPLFVLIGSDNLASLDRWRDHHSLLELATIVVFPRQGHPLDEGVLARLDLRRKHKDEILAAALDMPADELSSTEIRARLARGDTCESVLAPAVREYVAAHGLYRGT